MKKIFQIICTTLILNACNSQTSNKTHSVTQNDSQNGIIYFSVDNGANWLNSSKGLPEKISIGLGALATSNHFIGLATKDNGVYLYNFKNKVWDIVPTDKKIKEGKISTLAIIDSSFFIGTQHSGIFITSDKGKNWTNINNGLSNMTIRRFCEFDNDLYVCTNDGFYLFDKFSKSWKLEFGQNSLQTNGATLYKGSFYLATNKGIFSQLADKSWINSSPQFGMHNISSDNNQLYAMSYNELLLSSTDGKNWLSYQSGLPKELYTFNVLTHNDLTFAGQWDGIYKKNNGDILWEMSSNGLPKEFAVTNLKVFKDMLVIGTSERKLKEGMSTEK